jgi:hypothetical protein
MSIKKYKPPEKIDIKQFTTAPLRMQIEVEYKGKTPTEIFQIIGSPELIPQWYILAKRTIMNPSKGEEMSFHVEFTIFGEVYEEVLLWEEPNRYIYMAKGENFPLRGYTALIEVFDTEEGKGRFI